MDRRIKIPLKLILALVLGFVCAFFLNFFFTKNGIYSVSDALFGEESTWSDLFELYKESLSFSGFSRIVWERIVLLSLFFGFIISHFIFGVRKTFDFCFKYRWILGATLLVLLVIGKYNGNSMDSYLSIQNGAGTEYENPIIGFETPERSDEVLVSTARKMYYYNNGQPGGEISAASVIQNPLLVLCEGLLHTLGRDYAYSLDWYFYLVLAFLVSIEFFMIITDGKRLLSLASTTMIYFSTFYLWWGFPSQLLNTMGVVTFFYHCIKSERIISRGLFGLLTAWFSIRFVFDLYPAWEVPSAYTILVLMIWAFIKALSTIKKYNKKDWLVIAGVITLMIIGMLICYLDKMSYIASVSKTVYPGARRDYGGYTVHKLYDYIPAALFWLKKPVHMSEYGTIIGLFPIPLILSIYYTIKEKKKDILIMGLSLVSLILLLYCCNGGLSKTIANTLLLSHCTPWRVIDIVGYIEVILFARIMSLYKAKPCECIEESSKSIKIINKIGIVALSAMFAIYSIHMANYSIEKYMPHFYTMTAALLLCVVCYLIVSRYSFAKYKCLMIILICVSLFTGLLIRPVRKGTDVIFSKPVAGVIEQIKENDPDAVWVTYGSLISQSYVKCFGVDVINYVNTTPNMKLWKQLDPTGKYDEVYNRYAHVVLSFSDDETEFELIQEDAFNLYISYKDLYKTDATYLFSQIELDVDNEYFSLENIYQENGVIIYKINYAE